MQTLPICRATRAACDVMPPRAVRMPSAAFMPLMSSGLVSSRTRSTFSPRSAHSNASCAVKTTRPVAAPGPALRPCAEEAARGQSLGLGGRIEDGPEELVQRVRVHAQDGLLGRDALLLDHLDGDADLGEARALARARLQHPELAALDRELDVLHVAVVVLERLADAEQLARRPSASSTRASRSSAASGRPRRRPRPAR